jgi:segregation and condensation protein B
VGGGWQFRTRPDFQLYVVRHIKAKSARFSQSALETLAIVAYRQPITRAEVEHLRGVDCGGVLKTLLEKRLVRILGKKDIPGRPLIYGTSKEFLEVFGLKDLKSLPTLKEIQALDDVPQYERQEELPLGQGDGLSAEEIPSLFET